MKRTDILYGLDHWERLELDPGDVIERVLDNAYHDSGEPIEETLSHVDWPIKILVFKRRGIVTPEWVASRALDGILEWLDDEYCGPNGDITEPTDKMREAAIAFGRAVVADYVSYTCEPTGEVIEYTRKQAESKEPCVPKNGEER